MVEDVRDVEPIDAGFTHVRGRRPSKVVRPKVERHAALAEHRRRFFRAVVDAGMRGVGEHVPVVGVRAFGTTFQNRQRHGRERHTMRVAVLGIRRRDDLPPSLQIHVTPAHRAHFPAPLRGQQHHAQHVTHRLGEPRNWPPFIVRGFRLVQRKPELAQLRASEHAIPTALQPRFLMRHAGLASMQSWSTANVNSAEMHSSTRLA
jgi:hypothetical protein